MIIDVADLAGTEALGRCLGSTLFPGAVVALIGPLGAGKTHFVRAICEGIGLGRPKLVTSPTFVLIQEYPAPIPIAHFDAYRLNSVGEFVDLGAHEYFDGEWVSLVEWADRVEAALPAEHVRITIVPLDEHRRRFEIIPTGERYISLVDGLASFPGRSEAE